MTGSVVDAFPALSADRTVSEKLPGCDVLSATGRVGSLDNLVPRSKSSHVAIPEPTSAQLNVTLTTLLIGRTPPVPLTESVAVGMARSTRTVTGLAVVVLPTLSVAEAVKVRSLTFPRAGFTVSVFGLVALQVSSRQSRSRPDPVPSVADAVTVTEVLVQTPT